MGSDDGLMTELRRAAAGVDYCARNLPLIFSATASNSFLSGFRSYSGGNFSPNPSPT